MSKHDSVHKQAAPAGDLTSYQRERFSHGAFAHDVYSKGAGPAVIVIAEMPGITPHVLGFADRMVAMGCSAIVPDLFGVAGRDPYASSAPARIRDALLVFAQVCISREFTLFATARSSPVIDWLRGLAQHEHARRGGPGVGVVGMCFTGGFALAMAVDPRVLVPVLSQPSLPGGPAASHKHNIDCAPADLDRVALRCANEGLQVIGLRFRGDPLVPRERFQFLRERLGDGFIAIELEQADGHPNGLLPRRHSVLTGDLIDEPGEPTRAALDRVLSLLREKLLA